MSDQMFDLNHIDRSALAEFRQRLDALSYRGDIICARTREWPVSFRPGGLRAAAYEYLFSYDPALLDAIRLFLSGQVLTAAATRALFPEGLINSLVAIGLLGRADDGYRCPLHVFPVDRYHVVTDVFGDVFAANDRHTVLELIREQHLLSNALQRQPCAAALDLCTGCGIFALVASDYCDHVWAVDLNPRAVNCATFNALLNAVTNLTVLEGDLYDPVDGLTFDLIMANPPYNPACGAADAQMLSIYGGDSGEEIAFRILSGLERHLRPGGWAHIVSRFFFDGRPYWERMEHILDRDTVNACLVHKPRRNIFTLSNLVTSAWSVGPAGLAALADYYKSRGIEQEAWGILNMVRVSSGGMFRSIECDLTPEVPLREVTQVELSAMATL